MKKILILGVCIYLVTPSWPDERHDDKLPADYKTAQDIINKRNIDGKAKHWTIMDLIFPKAKNAETQMAAKASVPSKVAAIPIAAPAPDMPMATNSSPGFPTMAPKPEHKPVDLTEGLPPVDHPFTFAADIQAAIYQAVAAYVPGFAALPEEQKSIVAQVNMMAAVAVSGGKK